MFRIEVKHAFAMFIKKTRNEIKNIFKDSIPGAEAESYILHLQDVEETAKKLGILTEEGLPSNINFQVRVVKTEKLIELHAFGLHEWDNPPKNDENLKTWGMMKIPLVTQKESEPMPEKYTQRKIEFHLSVSYVTKCMNNEYYKHSQVEWEPIKRMEEKVTTRLIEKAQVEIKGDSNNVAQRSGETGNRDPYDRLRMNNHDNQGNEQYITTRDRRNLPKNSQ
jgi:hypothetical protein